MMRSQQRPIPDVKVLLYIHSQACTEMLLLVLISGFVYVNTRVNKWNVHPKATMFGAYISFTCFKNAFYGIEK